jgi:hypothetical protein
MILFMDTRLRLRMARSARIDFFINSMATEPGLPPVEVMVRALTSGDPFNNMRQIS